jgi:hypothetical protein
MEKLGVTAIAQFLVDGTCEVKTDTIADKRFLGYISQPRFNRIEFGLIGLRMAFTYEASRDSNDYYPIVVALPANYSNADFLIIVAVGKMDLDMLKILINFNGANKGFALSQAEPIPATTVMALSNKLFFDSDGRKMPSGIKPVDIKTYFRISGRKTPDSTLAFADLLGNE